MSSSHLKFAYPDSLDMEDKLAYGVGALVMDWAGTERVFYGLLEAMVGRRDTANGAVIWLSIFNNRARLDLISNLAKAQDLAPVAAEEIEAACLRFKALSKARNFFCHGTYRADLKGRILGIENSALVEGDESFEAEFRPLNHQLLNQVKCAINDAKRLNYDAWLLLVRLRAALRVQQPALPEGLDEYLKKIGAQLRQ